MKNTAQTHAATQLTQFPNCHAGKEKSFILGNFFLPKVKKSSKTAQVLQY